MSEVYFLSAALAASAYVLLTEKSSSSSQQEEIQKNGVFVLAPDQTLIYKTTDNKIYNAGPCSNCVSACAGALELQDVYRADYINGGYVPVLVSSAQDLAKSYLDSAVGELTQEQCLSVISTTNDPAADMINEKTEELISQSTTSSFISIFGFIKENKEEILNLAEQFGVQTVLSKVIGEYALVVMCLPALLSGDGNLQYAAGVQLGVFGGHSFIYETLPRVLESVTENATVEAGAAEFDVAIEISTEITTKMVTEATAEALSSIIEFTALAMDPLFDLVAFMALVGIVFDLIDPCGLKNTLTPEMLAEISAGFDNAWFNNLMNNVGMIPVEWHAEYVKQFNIVCSQDDQVCNDNFNKASVGLSKTYQDSLTVNSLGQSIKKLSSAEFDAQCSEILGIPVKLDTGKGLSISSFKKTMDYVTLELANGNEIVADFLEEYWYIALLLAGALVWIALKIK